MDPSEFTFGGLTIHEINEELAKELLMETSPETILQNLQAIKVSFCRPLDLATAGRGPLKFLRAGGLPAVVRHLRGTATSGAANDPDASPSAISNAAAEVMSELLSDRACKMGACTLAEVKAATGVVPPLIDALRDAASNKARAMAAHTLGILAKAQPPDSRAMAEAGVIGLVLDFYAKIGDLSERENLGNLAPATDLACWLVCSQAVAARDLREAICGADTFQTYAALALLQVCRFSSYVFLPFAHVISLLARKALFGSL